MKPKRPSSRPFQVETKHLRSTTAPPAVRRASPDSKIRAWHAAMPAPKPPLPPEEADDILLQAELECHRARLLYGNDPDIDHQAAEKLARVDQMARHTASIVPQPHSNLGPGVWLGVKSVAVVGIVVKALSALLPGVTVVRTEGNRVPRSLGGFVKQMGKDRK